MKYPQQLYDLFMQVPAPICIFEGPEHKFTLANPPYLALIGGRPVVGKPIREALPELEGQGVYERLDEVYRTGQAYHSNESILKVTKVYDTLSKNYFNFVYQPWFDSEGNTKGVLAFASDITEQTVARQRVEQLVKAAEAANMAKTQFLAHMSHEIRTPLGIITGFTDLALEPNQSLPEIKSYLQAIKRNSQQLAKILGDILDLSKIEVNKMEIEELPFSLPSALEEVISFFIPQAKEKNIELHLKFLGSCPDVVKTDPTKLRQILINLIGNALKFTEKGSITLTCRAEPATSTTTMLEFSVIDTGVGMTEEQQQRLFQPFAQGDSSTSRKYGGTGLGLLLSRQMAKALGGDLILKESHPHRGSHFSVKIKVWKMFNETKVVPEKEPLKRSSLLENLRVLLVEDSPDNQLLIRRYIENAGGHIDVALNGGEGLQKALNQHFDIVLMDIQMPEMDGHEATKTLRSKGFSRPILALTAHALHEEKERALRNGFDEYLTKPIQKDDLINQIRKFCSRME